MPKKRKMIESSATVQKAGGSSIGNEEITEVLPLSTLTRYMGGDPALRSQPTIPSSDDLITYLLLEKAAEVDEDFKNLVKEVRLEELEFLKLGMTKVRGDPELQYMLGGDSMAQYRA